MPYFIHKIFSIFYCGTKHKLNIKHFSNTFIIQCVYTMERARRVVLFASVVLKLDLKSPYNVKATVIQYTWIRFESTRSMVKILPIVMSLFAYMLYSVYRI